MVAVGFRIFRVAQDIQPLDCGLRFGGFQDCAHRQQERVRDGQGWIQDCRHADVRIVAGVCCLAFGLHCHFHWMR